MDSLIDSQRAALASVEKKARANQLAARAAMESLLKNEGMALEALDEVLTTIQDKAPIDVSFHPDRPDKNGSSVVESMYDSGCYKNQFETGISNGGLTAFDGGQRDVWEEALFGGVYQEHRASPADRPKYGALNLLDNWDGACPRFGSCYFRLKSNVATRCSFAFGDSVTNPNNLATIDIFDSVLASTLDAIKSSGRALGRDKLDVESFIESLSRRSFLANTGFDKAPGRNLDEYIEVHVHGSLNLTTDVEWLVADGAFRDTPTGEQLVKLGGEYGFSVFWNPGFFLPVEEVPSNFRGLMMPPLAEHIAKSGVLDAVIIGQAVVSLRADPNEWRTWGTFEETLQYLKQLWHVLVTFGHMGRPH